MKIYKYSESWAAAADSRNYTTPRDKKLSASSQVMGAIIAGLFLTTVFGRKVISGFRPGAGNEEVQIYLDYVVENQKELYIDLDGCYKKVSKWKDRTRMENEALKIYSKGLNNLSNISKFTNPNNKNEAVEVTIKNRKSIKKFCRPFLQTGKIQEGADATFGCNYLAEERQERVAKAKGKKKSNLSNNSNKLEKNNISINNERGLHTMKKKADKFSDKYYRDALTGLKNSDSLMRAYYRGYKSEYSRKHKGPERKSKDLYFHSEEDNITNQSHPNAIMVADSLGEGGLVENSHEQSRRTQEVAARNPSGNFRGNYAWIRNSLTKRSK